MAQQRAQAVRDALDGARDFNNWLIAQMDADLTGLSPAFTTPDIATMRTAFLDLIALRNIAQGLPVPGPATGVKVYRGTAPGAETVLVATLGAVLTYTDTGSAGTSGTPPPTMNTAQLPNVAGVTVTPSASGGTFAAGAYYWVVTAVNALGETLPSLEVTATLTGAASSVVLNWNTLPAGYPQPAAPYRFLLNATQVIGPL